MVHLKIINPKPIEETPESQLIQLEKSQASKVPFPPDCPVLVLDKSPDKANILYSGDVAAVYVAFDHSSGSCHNCYRISCRNAGGSASSEVVGGDRIRYAINCPITVSSKANKADSDEAIEGIIKGFEIVAEGDTIDGSAASAPSFLYTVEVTAIGSNSEERTFRQRGISPEHIRFRETTSNNSLYHNDFDKTSVVSLDEPKSQSFGTPGKKATTPKVLHTGTFSPPCNKPCNMPPTPQTPSRRASFNGMNPPQLINGGELSEKKVFTKCHPLPQPHPTHFQGDLNENVRVPDFSFITNCTTMKAGMPEGCKSCVMCGEVRRCNNGKSTKTKSMKNSTKYSEDAVVIPNQNKGLCTLCDVNIWVIKASGVQVKWCKGCKVRRR
jgi:hypothetical protein